MTIKVGTGTSGTRFIATRYPVEKGLTGGTTTQEGNKMSLEPSIDLTSANEREGII